MDSELLALRRHFQCLQQQDNQHRLNERNVVEIINILSKKKKIIELIYTSDGKEFLTWAQLRREIRDELHVSGGKLNVVELPPLVNVDMIHVERAVSDILSDPDSGIRLCNGELITKEFINGLIVEAGELLKENGCVVLSEFAKNAHLPSSFVSDVFTEAVENHSLDAVLHDSAVYTDTFVRFQVALLRSSLIAAMRPITVRHVALRRGIYVSLLPNLIRSLEDSHALPGRFEGGDTGKYIPAIFEKERSMNVNNIYMSSHFVTYAALQQFDVANPKMYLENNFNPPRRSGGPSSDSTPRQKSTRGRKVAREGETSIVRSSSEFPFAGHSLSSCFIADRLLINLEHDVQVFLSGDTPHLDVADVLPTCIDWKIDGEVVWTRMFDLFPSLRTEALVLHHTTLVRHALIQSLKPQLVRILELKQEQRLIRSMIIDALAQATQLSRETQMPQIDELLVTLEETIDAIKREISAEASRKVNLETKRLRGVIQQRSQTNWIDLCVTIKSLSWVDSNLQPECAAAIHKNVLLSRCVPLMHDVLLMEALDDPAVAQKLPEVEHSEATRLKTIADVKKLLGFFEKKRQLPFQAAVDSLATSATDFASELEKLNSSGQIVLSCFHPPNKKSEREASAALRKASLASVETNSLEAVRTPHDLGSALGLLISAALGRRFNVTVPVPGRIALSVVPKVKEEKDSALWTRAEALVLAASNSTPEQCAEAVDAAVAALVELKHSILSEIT